MGVTEPGTRTVTGPGAVVGDRAGAERAGRADRDRTVGGRDGAQEYTGYNNFQSCRWQLVCDRY